MRKTDWFSLFLLLFVFGGKAQNLAVNPGFETGDTSGWSAFGSPMIFASTAQVHSGAYACLVTNRTATYMGVSQSFFGAMQAGTTYNVSIWLRLATGANQTMQVTMQKIDASGTTYAAITSGSISSSAWTQLSGQYTLAVNGTLTNLTIYFEMPGSSTNAYYADDFSVSAAFSSVVVPGTNGACLVDWATTFQRIDGFGASSAWRGSWTASQADLFFSTNASGTATSFDGRTNFPFAGCGFSFLRNHIAYAGSTAASAVPSTSETGIMQYAQARGARVWSAPWTPPTGFKNTNDLYDSLPITNGVNGGSYLGNGNNITNLNYASQLANYVASMKNTYAVNLYAISVQNEPDAQVNTYEACQWTGQQIHDFTTNLYSALVAKGFGSTKIILPESENWASNAGLLTPTLSDTNSAAQAGVIADHNYVADNNTGDTTIPAPITGSGQAIWETEVSQFGSYDGSITNAIYWAGRMHLYLTSAQANAWHYWWLYPGGGNNNEGLTDTNGVPAKRLYAMGQFARFVRPNFYRINVTTNSSSAQVSAYKDSVSSNFTVVAINGGSTTVTQVFNLANVVNTFKVTPWMTTSATNLALQPVVSVTNNVFSYALPALSIVTFTGVAGTNTPPVFAGTGNQTINPGTRLVLTNVAINTDSPPQALTFNVVSAPIGGTVNPTNGIFSWRPSIAQADTTNVVKVQAADQNFPGLSSTNSFSVIVNPVQPPIINSISFGTQLSLSVTGMVGPDYSLLASTNLVIWQLLYTTNPTTMPVTFTDTNQSLSARFYRLQLGP